MYREPRIAVMLHFDASSSDLGSVGWFKMEGAKYAGYHYLVLDDGTYVTMGPYNARMYHAGKCRPSDELVTLGAHYGDANSAFIGIAVAADQDDIVTPIQLICVAALTRKVFADEGWNVNETWRIRGHDDEAWPRGRKIDPTGLDPKHPVVSVDFVRRLVKYEIAA
jgi:N-acetyl-anhydromuramyl-L-alanine amidase AmpD